MLHEGKMDLVTTAVSEYQLFGAQSRRGQKSLPGSLLSSLRSSLFRFLLAGDRESEGAKGKSRERMGPLIFSHLCPRALARLPRSRLPERKRKRLLRRLSPQQPLLVVDKSRNMEHPGTFRNITEHPGTSNNYDNYEKNI